MDWSLIIFVVVVGLFAWRGFRSGFIRSLGRVLAVVAGYAAAIVFSGPLSAWVEAQFGLQGVGAFLAASIALFFGAGLGVTLIFALLRRLVFRGDEVSTASAIGGGVVGALVGGLLAIAIVWSFAFVRDIRSPGVIEETAESERSSDIETLAIRLAGGAVSAAMGAGSVAPEVARLGGVLMASPAEVMQRAQRVTTSTEFQALLQDSRNHAVLDSGQPELVQQLPAFRALAANPDVLALAEMAGFSGGDDLEAELASQLTDTWGRAQRVRNDPQVQAILADPEFRAALDSGNPVALLTDPHLLELADIIYADDNAASTPTRSLKGETGDIEATANQAPDDTSQAPAKIYQWTDSSGRIHYSDRKPED